MNFIYKNLFALPNLRPYTKHIKRIIPAIITGRISSFFLLLYSTPNSLCWLDGGPTYKNAVSKVGGPPESCGVWTHPTPQWLRPWGKLNMHHFNSVLMLFNKNYYLSKPSKSWRVCRAICISAACRHAVSVCVLVSVTFVNCQNE